ncbi:MAG: immunoglobulin domain-containing protein [Verrucomicrobiota bacterium]
MFGAIFSGYVSRLSTFRVFMALLILVTCTLPAKIEAAPTVDTQPTGVAATQGDTVELRVTATGTGSLNYRWRRSSVVSTVVGGFVYPLGVARDSGGNIYVTDIALHTVSMITPHGIVTVIAGSANQPGTADGLGNVARFHSPEGIATDSAGNLYVADWGNHTVRKLSPSVAQPGQWEVSTIAGVAGTSGSTNGGLGVALLNGPETVAVDGDGYIYVGDDVPTVRKISPNGDVITLAGGTWGSGDGTGASAQFGFPGALALDADRNVYVADVFNHAIRKVTQGGVVTTIAGNPNESGSADGGKAVARFSMPWGIAVGNDGSIIVADGQGVYTNPDTGALVQAPVNHLIRKVRQDGFVTTLAGSASGSGNVDGPGSNAKFNNPQGLVLDGSGNLYVADAGNGAIRKVKLGDIIPGETAATYKITGVTEESALAYQCAVTDVTGSVVSNPATIAVTSLPAVTTQPENSSVLFGGTASLGVGVSGSGTFSYQWRKSAVVTTLAGSAGFSGSADGTGSDARFNGTFGVAVDKNGTVYVSDGNHTIRKITPTGVVTTLAGSAGFSGTANGTGSAARFNKPEGLSVDKDGNVIVADWGNHAIRKVTPAGVVTTIAGTPGTSGDVNATGSAARFNGPENLVVDGDGTIYVVEGYNSKVRKISASGVVTTLAGGQFGAADGIGTAAQFSFGGGIVLDKNKNVYVSDVLNHTIRKITPTGVVTTIAGSPGVAGIADGVGPRARFKQVYGMAIDATGNLYVADGFSSLTVPDGAIQEFDGSHLVRKVTPTGEVTTIAGSVTDGSLDGIGSVARFKHPIGVAADGVGNLYVADTRNGTVRKITLPVDVNGAMGPTYSIPSATISNTAAYECVVSSGSLSSVSASGRVEVDGSPKIGKQPMDVSVSSGSGLALSVSASGAGTISYQWRKSAVVTTLAGSAGFSGSTDGTGRDARFNGTFGVAADKNGTVYVSDGNHTIRKITSGGIVTTLAGSAGFSGTADGTGSAARFHSPEGLSVDKDGNVIVADWGNHAIRKVTPAGVVTTIAGSPGTSGDVNATGSAARFNGPENLVVDGDGTIYVADGYNSKVRKISASGVVTTLAGGRFGTADGIGAAAQFSFGGGIVLDKNKNVYVSDVLNHTIRKITPGGVVTTIAGSPGVAGSADGVGSSARFKQVYGMAIDVAGNLYVADGFSSLTNENGVVEEFDGSHLVRKVTPAGEVTTIAGSVDAGSDDGVGSIARFKHPIGVAVDGVGNLYVADARNGTVRKMTLPVDVSGATGPIHSVPSATISNTGAYECVVSNPYGKIVSLPAGVVVIPLPPVITTQPIGAILMAGGSVKLTVVATGQGTLTYQWRKDGTVISGATSATYTVATAASDPAGKYDCLVKNAGGEVATRVASVLLPQTLTFAQPDPVTYGCAPILLGGSASSGSPLTYKVVSGSATVSGSTLTITGASSVVLKVSQPGDATHAAAADVSKTLVVAKKTLTVSTSSKTRLVGAANPAFALTYSGFVNGDTEAVLDKKPTVTTTATASSAEGTYPVTISGGSDNNYTLVYSTGATLLVTGFGGAYEALLLDQDHAPIGKLELTVPLNSLAYSGKLTLTTEAKSVSLLGFLQANSDGSAAVSTLTLTRKDLPTLMLNISVSGDSLTATLGRGDLPELTSGTTGTRLYTVPAKANAPWAGTYTMVFGDPTSSDVQKRDYPHGANYASVVITPATGILAFTGKLADGTNISGKMNPDAKGRYRLLIYESRIYLSGQLSLIAHPDTERFPNSFYIPSSSEESFLVWANTGGPKDNSYRAGFGPLEYGVSLDPWRAPVTGSKTVLARTLAQQLGLVNGSTDAAMISVDYGPDSIDLGTLGASLPRKVSLAPGATVSVVESVTPPVNTTKWTISVKPETGVFTGSFTLMDIVTSLATRHTRNVSFYGILRQGPTGDNEVGNGFFLLPALPSAATPEQPSLEIRLNAPAK